MKTKPSTTMEGFSIETHPYQNSSNQWAAAVQMISFFFKTVSVFTEILGFINSPNG